MDQANVGVGLGKVAKLAVGDRVEHLGEQAQVVGPVGDHLVEVIESAVGLAGVDEISDQPEAEQRERSLRLALKSVVRLFRQIPPDQRTLG